MSMAEDLATFVVQASYKHLSEIARQQLRVRLLDSLGCAIGALPGEPIRLLRQHLEDFGGQGHCSLIGGGRTAPDRAALYNGALVRYLDFNDSYIAKGESCHPSDNLGAVLAASQYAKRSGQELLTALAVAYQVQCRLSDVAPVRHKGFDHTTQGSYAVASGVSKALGLDIEPTVNALALSGTPFNALRVTRTGALSHWKGLAYPNTAFGCTHATFLAMRGISGPREVFEGKKGFMEAIAGPFRIDWSKEDLERVTRTGIKKYNAEYHSQSALEGILELKDEYGFTAHEVRRVEIDIFDVAYHIIGGGDEGDKTLVHTKEEADHSLPYMAAAAILDGQVMPAQYTLERIRRQDVQDLLKKVFVRPHDAYSARFPEEMPCLVRIYLQDGGVLVKEKRDYEGFPTHPMSWETVVEKFERLSAPYSDATLISHPRQWVTSQRLSAPYSDATLRRYIIAAVEQIETIQVDELMHLLARVQG